MLSELIRMHDFPTVARAAKGLWNLALAWKYSGIETGNGIKEI